MVDEYTPDSSTPAGESSEYPKPLVKVTRGGPNGFDCDLLVVGSSDAEKAGTEAGYQTIDVPAIEDDADFAKFPRWMFHQDGRRMVVHSQEEQDKLDGFEDKPIDPEGLEKVDVPPPAVADAVAIDPRHMPPRPVDRG